MHESCSIQAKIPPYQEPEDGCYVWKKTLSSNFSKFDNVLTFSFSYHLLRFGAYNLKAPPFLESAPVSCPSFNGLQICLETFLAKGVQRLAKARENSWRTLQNTISETSGSGFEPVKITYV